MRQSLLTTFDEVHILDLGGASGSTYDDGNDENVFDITIGVAVTILAKTGGPQRVRYSRIGGTRIQKYQSLAREKVSEISAEDVHPASPNYFFVPHSIRSADDATFNLCQIFDVFGIGIVTARDALTIAYTAGELITRVRKFESLSIDEAREIFKLGKDVQGWSVARAQEELRETGIDRKSLRRLSYRPFDDRVTYYTGKSNGFVSRPTHDVMKHFFWPMTRLSSTV